jgi:hypothetical protein
MAIESASGIRVTRLGEFSPNAAIVYFRQFIETRYLQKMGSAIFWAFFQKLIWSSCQEQKFEGVWL